MNLIKVKQLNVIESTIVKNVYLLNIKEKSGGQPDFLSPIIMEGVL